MRFFWVFVAFAAGLLVALVLNALDRVRRRRNPAEPPEGYLGCVGGCGKTIEKRGPTEVGFWCLECAKRREEGR